METIEKKCTVEGCENKLHAKGFCAAHYRKANPNKNRKYSKATKNIAVCCICGESFLQKHAKQQCCSLKCEKTRNSNYKKIAKQEKDNGIIKKQYKKVCFICGETIKSDISNADNTCSKECKEVFNRRRSYNSFQNLLYTKKCKICNKIFETARIDTNCCGKTCAARWQNHIHTHGRNKTVKSGALDEGKIIYRGYKDPLIPVDKKYFGYEGVLLEKNDRVQCHICGRWFAVLGSHLKTHSDVLQVSSGDTLVQTYKDMFGLLRKTSLVSMAQHEAYIKSNGSRAKMIHARGFVDFTNFSNKKRYPDGKGKAEWKNMRGLCFLQLLSFIRETATKLGRTPKIDELTRNGKNLYWTIRKTYGSYGEAVNLLKLLPGTRNGRQWEPGELSEEFLLESLNIVYKNQGRAPRVSDCGTGLLPEEEFFIKAFGSFKRAVRTFMKPKEMKILVEQEQI